MTEALAALAVLGAVAALPAFAISHVCRGKGLTPKYLLIGLLSGVMAALILGPVHYLFSRAEYEAFSLFDPAYCAANQWQCHFADFIFGNAWWLFLVVSALLIYVLLRFVVAIRPNALSRTAAS